MSDHFELLCSKMLRPGFENFHSQYSTHQSILKILCYMLLGISSSSAFRNSSSEKCDNPTCFHRFYQAFSSTKKQKNYKYIICFNLYLRNVTFLQLLEAVVQRCSIKKVFLEISQNSQNFAKFLGTPFFTEHLWWLLLNFLKTSEDLKVSWCFRKV